MFEECVERGERVPNASPLTGGYISPSKRKSLLNTD